MKKRIILLILCLIGVVWSKIRLDNIADQSAEYEEAFGPSQDGYVGYSCERDGCEEDQ